MRGYHGQSDLSSETIPTLVCLACGKQMRLVTAQPDMRPTNLMQYNYICDCGESTSNLIARKGQAAKWRQKPRDELDRNIG